jgi:CRISPR-associated endonuclease Cas1
MAANETVSHLPHSDNARVELSIPRHGVVTLYGYGIQVRVDRGHLLLEDGIGVERRQCRLPRVGHGLRRLVVIGSDGIVSLAALRWLADQDAAFVMLDRDGSVLVTTGPIRSSDAKLRRAQALSHHSGAAVRITRELISQKIAGQARVARYKLLDTTTADTITRFGAELPRADSVITIRLIESQAARAYWSAWSTLPINFPKNQLLRVPEHWRSFGARVSPLTGSPRLATNPPNAILNYLYALLESEARLAAAALGLDPGMGVLHVDTTARDSLACDLMEVVRPQVDAYLLDWITRQPLSREWFFEQRDGNCRLMAPFAVQLSKTAPIWGRAVEPITEWVARAFWLTIRKSDVPFATRLTQGNKRQAKGAPPCAPALSTPRPQTLCRGCGKNITAGRTHCAQCSIEGATERLADAARLGRLAAQTRGALAKQADSQRRHSRARLLWDKASQPTWLTPEMFSQRIQPLLSNISTSVIRSTIGVSRWYASRIRQGYRPHPRHWEVLARLTSVSVDGKKKLSGYSNQQGHSQD